MCLCAFNTFYSHKQFVKMLCETNYCNTLQYRFSCWHINSMFIENGSKAEQRWKKQKSIIASNIQWKSKLWIEWIDWIGWIIYAHFTHKCNALFLSLIMRQFFYWILFGYCVLNQYRTLLFNRTFLFRSQNSSSYP